MASSAVQLDDDAEWLVVVVTAATTTSRDGDLLAPGLGQPVRSLNASDLAVLEHALDPVCHITEGRVKDCGRQDTQIASGAAGGLSP